ncbi:unnamed protein product, partial [Pocillopora meandrina]
GTSRGITQFVSLRNYNESIVKHLSSCHLSRETLTEYELILARVGIFELPVSKLGETIICPRHRKRLGKPCQYPTHQGGRKAIKNGYVVNLKMAKEILKFMEWLSRLDQVSQEISEKASISIFLHPVICSNCWKRHKATIEESA